MCGHSHPGPSLQRRVPRDGGRGHETDPDYRRRGLLTEVGRASYTSWKEAGIPFVVGIPNDQWRSRPIAFGFTPVAELPWWVRRIDPIAVLAKKIGLNWSRRASSPIEPREREMRVSPLADTSPLDELWHRTGEEGVVRDSAWYQWRYLNAVPRCTVVGAWRGNSLVGVVALRSEVDDDRLTGFIGEARACELGVLRCLLARSCGELRNRGVARAAILAQPGSLLEEAALSLGFLPRRATFLIQAVDLGGRLPRAALFQGGDFDVV
jgi:hypothetical protein